MKHLFTLLLILSSQLLVAQICADTVKLGVLQKSDGLISVGVYNTTSFPNQVDFGDGYIGDVYQSPSHLYIANGTYNICLTVNDTIQGCISNYCLPVVIADAIIDPCAVKFEYFMTDSSSAYFVPFFSSNSFIGSNVIWDFDNGQIFNDNSVHQIDFVPNNTYNVCLQSINTLIGCSHTFCDTVIISSSICPFSMNMAITQQQEIVELNFSSPDYSFQYPNLIDYGDGYIDFHTTHRYASTGTYIISAQIVDNYPYWNCETTLVDTVTVLTVPSNLCDHNISFDTIGSSGYYQFNSNVIEAMNGAYSYQWDFGSGYVPGSNIENDIAFPATGIVNVCNIVTSTAGCADTNCINVNVSFSPDAGICSLNPTEIVRVYKDAVYSLFKFRATSVPPLLPVDLDVGMGTVTGNPGEVTDMGSYYNPALLTTYNIDASVSSACGATSYDTLTPNSWSNFTCDSILEDILVEDVGGGIFKITPIFDSYVTNNLWAFYGNYQVNFNLNGYHFFDASFSSGPIGIYIQMPYQGNFSCSANVSCTLTPCNSQNTYFSINNTGLAPSSNCDAYFTLVEDTSALLPYTYILNNFSSGNDLAYLWHFGDGDSSTAILPSHTYASPGFYEVTLTVTDTINGCTDYYFQDAHSPSLLIQYIVAGSTLDIPANSFTEIKGYPNPTERFFNISGLESAEFMVEVFETSGRLIKSTTNANIIDMEPFASGIYLVMIKQGGNTNCFKVIKQ